MPLSRLGDVLDISTEHPTRSRPLENAEDWLLSEMTVTISSFRQIWYPTLVTSRELMEGFADPLLSLRGHRASRSSTTQEPLVAGQCHENGEA